MVRTRKHSECIKLFSRNGINIQIIHKLSLKKIYLIFFSLCYDGTLTKFYNQNIKRALKNLYKLKILGLDF